MSDSEPPSGQKLEDTRDSSQSDLTPEQVDWLNSLKPPESQYRFEGPSDRYSGRPYTD